MKKNEKTGPPDCGQRIMQQMMIAPVFMGSCIARKTRLAKTFRARHPWPMTRDEMNAICAEQPWAEVSDPWGGGHDAWKVGGKMFACIGTSTPGIALTNDSTETAEMLITAGIGQKVAYFHRSWVLLPWATEADEARHRIETSYKIIRSKLTKKLRDTLG